MRMRTREGAVEGSGKQNRKPAYISDGPAPEQKPHNNERIYGKAVEAKPERQKPLPAESAPDNHGHTMEDPTAVNDGAARIG